MDAVEMCMKSGEQQQQAPNTQCQMDRELISRFSLCLSLPLSIKRKWESDELFAFKFFIEMN